MVRVWNNRVAPSVAQVRTTFGGLGLGALSPIGTGFWLRTHDEHDVFVTNKHNVDPELTRPRSGYSLEGIEVRLRRAYPHAVASLDPGEFFRCTNTETNLFASQHRDVAILVDPSFAQHDPETHPPAVMLAEQDLANDEWFAEVQEMMDDCYFIGYAASVSGNQVVPFWDTVTNYPVARQAIIASSPQRDFRHADIPTRGVLLVSGMSFKGASGSPVLTLPISQADGVERPARLIGIMSGHFVARERQDVFVHAGLSYLTKSNCIAQLIQVARSCGWKNG